MIPKHTKRRLKELDDKVKLRMRELRGIDDLGTIGRRERAITQVRAELEDKLCEALRDMEHYGSHGLAFEATKASAYLTLFNSVYR